MPDPSPPSAAQKLPLGDRLKALVTDYGPLAITIYFVLFASVLGGFYLAIRLGFKPSSAGGEAGSLGAAWVATKLTQPLRILATLALTPLVASLLKRLRRQPPTA